MKKKVSLIFVSIFLMLGIVCGALVYNADTLFLTSTSESTQDEEKKDEETKIQASGNWIDYAKNNRPSGSGTYSSPYLISSAQTFANYMFMVNEGYHNSDSKLLYKESFARLTADIDLSAHYWTPIGNGNNIYAGNFDGNGHTISGLTISYNSSNLPKGILGIYNGIGLFGLVSGSSIYNFTLTNSQISFNRDQNITVLCLGSVVGMSFSADININDVISTTSIKITGSNSVGIFAGGLVGACLESRLSMYRCHNLGSFSFSGTNNLSVGGVAGLAQKGCDISYCSNFSDISLTVAASSYYAGIIAAIDVADGKSYIDDCVNYGNVVISGASGVQTSFVGGLCGAAVNNVGIRRSINYGRIKGTSQVGGIVGQMGQPQQTSKPWYLFGGVKVDKAAYENVAIMNCINYGEVSGSSEYGSIVGQMNGSDNIRGCYTTNANRVGNWQYANGTSTSSYTCQLNHVDYWPAFDHYKASFYTSLSSYNNGGRHSYDCSETIKGYAGRSWRSAAISTNSAVGTWVITTLIYDYYGGSRNGFKSSYKYSLVPSSLLGTATLNTKYARGGSASYDFDNDEDDKKLLKITLNVVSGDSVGETTLTYKNAIFYYIRGKKDGSKSSLKYTYNANFLKYRSSTSNINGVSATMNSDTNVSSNLRVNNLSFDPKGNSLISFTVVFQSQPKTLNFKYKIGRLKPSIGNTDASFEFFDLANKNDFLTQSGGTSYYYYKQDINFTVTPNKGYAVLSIIKRANDSDLNMNDRYKHEEWQDYIIDKRSVCNSHFIVASLDPLGGSGVIEDLNPYNFGEATVNYKFLYDKSSIREEFVVYIAPIQYTYIKASLDKVGVEKDDGKNCINQISYAFKGEGGVTVDSNNKAHSEFKIMKLSRIYNDEVNSELKNDTSTIFSEYINYGYKYTLNGFSYNNRNDNAENVGRQIDIAGQTNLQLNTCKSIKFSMSALLDAAIQKDSERSNQTLHIVIKRELIKYEVNLINMVDSYKSTAYSSKTDIGGDSNIYKENDSSKNLFKGNVEDFAVYNFVAKAGYSFGGTRMYLTNTAMLGVEADPFNMSNYTEKKFQKILDKYMEICNWDVKNLSKNSDGNYVLNIYAYYTLQSYNISFCTEINGSKKSANYTFTPTNFASSQAKASGEETNATATAKYYAPVTLRVDSVDGNRKNVKFLGWFMGDKLLSLDREYKFLLDPEYAVTDNSKISGEIRGKENSSNYGFTLVARFASYNESSGSLTSSGNKTIYINNANDLLLLSQKVNSGTTYEGYVIKQTANIDMENVIFNPIGTSEHQFKGTYDGQNYIISNLKFICGAYNGYLKHLYNVGLFGYTNGATIKNLTIKDSTFNAFGKAGIFVAEAYNSHLENLNNFNSGLTLNAVNFFDIYGNECNSQDLNYARIKGSLPAELSDANNSSFDWITRLYPNSRSNLAGLVGYMNGGSAFACSVNASIEGNAGFSTFQGLVGNLTASAKIDQCCVENSSNNGGLTVANITSGSITNSYYRYANNTEYVGLSGGTQNSIPTDTTIWFRLANGNWALRVMYWS